MFRKTESLAKIYSIMKSLNIIYLLDRSHEILYHYVRLCHKTFSFVIVKKAKVGND